MLPQEVLSSTSCICQIFNSKQKKAVVIDENGRSIKINDVTKKSLSEYVCFDRSEKKLQRYKSVDIYWPVPMLKVTKSFFLFAIWGTYSCYLPLAIAIYVYVCIHLQLNISHISYIDSKSFHVKLSNFSQYLSIVSQISLNVKRT